MIKSSLYRANRASLTILQCNKIIETTTDEDVLLKRLCEVIVYSCGYQLCWIGFIDNDPSKRVKPIASVGFDDGYLDNILITWDNTSCGNGPTGMAIKTKKPVVAQNILENKEFEPWREEALKRGYGSSIAIPLYTETKMFGSINIYAPETNAFDQEELKLLETVAENISKGIASLRC
ncbi:MAG TPA: GAF domain-containing protein [candidate division Zixibacteria bacterium]|nr:GAF domain-containing protein [candidate division Zixibacteria bacterium]